MRARPEVVFVHAPGHRAIVDGAASRLIAIVLDGDGCGPRIAVGSPGNGLALDVGAQILPLEITQLIVRIKVLRGEPRTALEPDHFHSRFAELGRKNTARCAHADNDDIGLFRCHGSPLVY